MKKPLFQILFLASLLLVGCKGKDGDPGPMGQTGQTGATGTTGAKGDTGATGTGFDAAVRDGNVAITFSGNRPDNVPFTSKQDFKYILDGGSPYDDSYVVNNEDGSMTFYIARYLGAVDEHHNNNYVHITFDVSSTGAVTARRLDITTVVIDGTKFFSVSEINYGVDDGNNDPFAITNYSYDATKGHLKFSLAATFKASNSTGYDLVVAGVSDVTVYEPLNDLQGGD